MIDIISVWSNIYIIVVLIFDLFHFIIFSIYMNLNMYYDFSDFDIGYSYDFFGYLFINEN